MSCYRISKYDTSKVHNHDFSCSQWTSIADIGHVFGGRVLTFDEYAAVESKYLDFVEEFLRTGKSNKLRITSLENYSGLNWKNGQLLDAEEVILFCKNALREECWGKLECETGFIHFGYDYYIYVGTDLEPEMIEALASKHNLFYEKTNSPYFNG